MFAILFLLLALPFVALKDWFTFVGSGLPREIELNRASHGAAMVVLAVIALNRMPYTFYNFGIQMTADNRKIAIGICLFIIVWGVFWFCISQARSQGYPDMRLVGRAVGKLGFAAALLWAVSSGKLFEYVGYRAWLNDIAMVVVFWCFVTAGVKIALLKRGPPPFDGLHPPAMPYGNAPFGSGGGLNQ